MGWDTDLQDASFRGVPFDCMTAQDKRDYAQAIYQAPYSNDAEIEAMGADPSDFEISAILTGDDYKAHLDALLAALDMLGSGELIHPVYGIIQASPISRVVKFDAELIDGCIVSMSFKSAVNQTTEAVFTPLSNPTNNDLATLVMATPAMRLKQLQDQLPFYSQMQTLSALSDSIGNGVFRVRQMLGVVTTGIDDFLSPPNWIAGLLADVSGLTDGFLPGEGAIAAWRAIASKVGSMADVFSSNDAMSAPIPEPLLQVSHMLVVGGLISAAQTILAGEVDQPTLTPPELGQIRADVRTAIQSAIVFERAAAIQAKASANLGGSSSNAPLVPLQTTRQIKILKKAADDFHVQVQSLIERRPPFVSSPVPMLCCSRWLAHRLYGDHARARELVRLNPQVTNPAILYAGMRVAVYVR